MKYLISKFFSANLIVIASCAATANADDTIPATAAPAATTEQPSPKTTVPLSNVSSAGSKITYVGPTANITDVANHVQVQAKSLTSLVTVDPGLVLTRPITISIAYISPWVAAENERKTQTYVPSSGNRFLQNDLEGDGKPRKVHMDITLSEAKPAGGAYSFNVPVDLALDPLYDVNISPLVFQLVKGCSTAFANQIDLNWFAPDKSELQTVHFAAKDNETFNIQEFGWARSEVSAAANLHKVVVYYRQRGVLPPNGFGPAPGPGTENLVPGQTQRSNQGLVSGLSPGGEDCQATLDYTVTYQLRAYFVEPNVRDHR
jgi:hypothetical protein